MSGIPSWAVRGAKVVCIRWTDEDAVAAAMFSLAPLAVDAIYTIRESMMQPGGPAVRLVEVSNAGSGWFDIDMPYAVERFRPLITQQDDLATHFKALLDVPEQVGA